MTPQQETAIAYPCEQAYQCADQRYKKYVRMGSDMFSTLLTVNVGEE